MIADQCRRDTVLNSKDVYGYMMSIQKGNNLVTNPDPGTVTEVTISAFISETEPVSFTNDALRKADQRWSAFIDKRS